MVVAGFWGGDGGWRSPGEDRGQGQDLIFRAGYGLGRGGTTAGGEGGRPLEAKTEQQWCSVAFSSTSSQHSTSQARPVSANRSNGRVAGAMEIGFSTRTGIPSSAPCRARETLQAMRACNDGRERQRCGRRGGAGELKVVLAGDRGRESSCVCECVGAAGQGGR